MIFFWVKIRVILMRIKQILLDRPMCRFKKFQSLTNEDIRHEPVDPQCATLYNNYSHCI